MVAFNDFFKNLAEKLKLPAFFKGNTLLFNNFFLALLVLVLLIALILVIVLVPNKKKADKKSEGEIVADKAENDLSSAADSADSLEAFAPVGEESEEDAEPTPAEEDVILPEAESSSEPAPETGEEETAEEAVLALVPERLFSTLLSSVQTPILARTHLDSRVSSQERRLPVLRECP